MKKILSFLTKKPLALAAVALFSMSSFAQETGAPAVEGGSDDDDGGSNTGLIVLIIILSVVIIAGAILAFIIYRQYKSKGVVTQKNKETSMALINSAKNDKLVESQARETNQIDP